MSLATLPGELYSAIVSQLDRSECTQTVLALSRALPFAPIPLDMIFHFIRIKQPWQAVSLYLRLRNATNSDEPCTSWVKGLSVETWTVDADIVINIIRLLSNLQYLNLRIGPRNFSPEHLEELFKDPMSKLNELSIRFRPYVDKASYYQFHKGVYFDSTLHAIAKWPPQELSVLSIVQDPQDDTTLPHRRSFAQPIVFFLLDPNLSILIHSPAIARSLKFLRLRIPSRPVARSLSMLPGRSAIYHSQDALPSVPNLEFLDVSTCGVIEGELDMIFARYQNLKHLILDRCAVLRPDLRQGEWGALGKRCALIGVNSAKDREKELKAWLEEQWVEKHNVLGSDGGPAHLDPMRAEPQRRAGRRGLATATISFRSRSPEGQNTRSSTVNIPKAMLPKIRILPFIPHLQTLAITPSFEIEASRYPAIRAEFEAGWAEGIAQLGVTRARMRTSSRNGVHLKRFTNDPNMKGPGLEGLEDVDVDDDESFIVGDKEAPILCLAGPKNNDQHVSGCAHSIGWEIWKPEAD